MIANHRREALVVNEKVKNFAVLWPFRDQISHGNDSIVRLKIDQLEQIGQLIIATVDVANYDCARHGINGTGPRAQPSRLPVEEARRLQSPAALAKQMMYRVNIPVSEVRRHNLGAGGA